MSTPLLDAALRYAARGWAVLPLAWPVAGARCSCGHADCRHIGKHPAGRLVPHGVRQATTDESTIRSWWRRSPFANVGLALGPGQHNRGGAGLWAVDVDAAKGGSSTLVQLVREHGPLGPTLHAHTGGAGDHFFFAWPEGQRVAQAANRLGPGVDVIGAGWHVVAAPSLHVSGARYAWEDETAPVLEAPAWLLELVVHPAELRPASSARAPIAASRVTDVEKRAVAYLLAMPPAISGQYGDRQTMKACHKMVKGFALPAARALELLVEHYNPRCVPPWEPAALERKIAYCARSNSITGFLLRAS